MKIDIIIFTNIKLDVSRFFKVHKLEKLINTIEARISYRPKVSYDSVELKKNRYYLIINLAAKLAFEKFAVHRNRIILICPTRGISDDSGIAACFLGMVESFRLLFDEPKMYGHPNIVAQMNVKVFNRFTLKNGIEIESIYRKKEEVADLVIDYLEAFEQFKLNPKDL